VDVESFGAWPADAREGETPEEEDEEEEDDAPAAARPGVGDALGAAEDSWRGADRDEASLELLEFGLELLEPELDRLQARALPAATLCCVTLGAESSSLLLPLSPLPALEL
jgi:hypothetical protein